MFPFWLLAIILIRHNVRIKVNLIVILQHKIVQWNASCSLRYTPKNECWGCAQESRSRWKDAAQKSDAMSADTSVFLARQLHSAVHWYHWCSMDGYPWGFWAVLFTPCRAFLSLALHKSSWFSSQNAYMYIYIYIYIYTHHIISIRNTIQALVKKNGRVREQL